jgi:ubiquinone/menaquinone biosynthesis C-methylase UbiE
VLIKVDKTEAKIVIPGNDANAASGFFGDSAQVYAQQYEEDTPLGYARRMRRKKVLELFDKPGGKVLDVGCGPAEMVQALLNLGCEFWGVDPSPKMIEICRRRFGGTRNTQFLPGEAGRLSFADNSFDAVLCMGVVDFLQNVPQAVEDMLRVLKPGGTIIVTFSNRHSPYAWWKAYVFYRALAVVRRITSPKRINDPIFSRRQIPTPQTASNLFSKAGASVDQIVGDNYNLLLTPLDEIWPAGTLWLNRKLEEGRGGKTDWLAAGFILKARKNKSENGSFHGSSGSQTAS